jgi:parallel beta-helix repeat protein
MGAVIDLFDNATPSGKGINQTSGGFAPQQLVILYANVTSNGTAVENKSVAFQVSDPNGNIIFSGSNSTDANGIATVGFRLATNATFGTWTAIASVDVAQVVVKDTLTFRVGWIIIITNITTLDSELMPQAIFYRQDLIVFNLTVENTALTNEPCTITIDVEDAAQYSIIDLELINLTLTPGENYVLSNSSEIPITAAIGLATVSAAPYTAPIEDGGILYSPAISTTFEIEAVQVPDIGISNITLSSNSVFIGETLRINVTVFNNGTEVVAFNVSVYYNNSFLIETIPVSILEPTNQVTLTFTWNTTSVTEGYYQIMARAPLPGDPSPSDNTRVDGIVQVKTRPETIIINLDGSISSPVPANITTSDWVTYTFTGNNYLPIIVNRSNIIINGMGHTLRGSGNESGFSLTGISNVTIKNTTITDFTYGVFLNSSSGNALSGNNVTANTWGIALLFSAENVLSGNVMTRNQYNFGVIGSALSDFVNDVSTSNLVNGEPVYYLMNRSNIVISPKTYPTVGYLGLVNCKNVTVQNLTLSHNVQGLLLANTTDLKITDNNFTANGDGIDLLFSSGSVLSGNNMTANGDGIYLAHSSGNILSGNNVANNVEGFWLYPSCDNNTLSGNNITANSNGIMLDSSSGNVLSGNNVSVNSLVGITLGYSSDNALSGNNVTANGDQGIWLAFSSGNVLSGNNITANTEGIDVYFSSGNMIFHNDFLDNPAMAENCTNTWDDGYPSGGNYWSDYRTRYPNAAENDSSAIWNASYIIDANNIDRYPLMGPFSTFAVGTWNGTAYSVDTVSNSTITDLNFSAATKTLSFNVTGANGTAGFCRVTIPLLLMSGRWTVTVNGTQLSAPNLNITIYENYTYIYFTYHHSTETVKITSTTAIPELQPYMLLPLLTIITLLTAIVSKRKRNVKK